MLIKVKNLAKRFFLKQKGDLQWVHQDESSWLAKTFPRAKMCIPKSAYTDKIERLTQETNKKGQQPLWRGYPSNQNGSETRYPNDVRTASITGDFYTQLVIKKRPDYVVEFGTAFGVSGMYFSAGLEIIKQGMLLTFDPNDLWAEIARTNIAAISSRFKLTMGTFEENIDKSLPKGKSIDIAFIDAIHTKEFVLPQLEIVVAHSRSNSVIILDDINFSENMQDCWRGITQDKRFSAAGTFGKRVGLLELR